MIYIYSDYLDQLLLCGDYSLATGGLIDFNNFQVPCTSYIIIGLVNNNFIHNDATFQRIDCSNTDDV